MNDSDVGYSFEWENEFKEWLSAKYSKQEPSKKEDGELYPQIKKEYSENFILGFVLDSSKLIN